MKKVLIVLPVILVALIVFIAGGLVILNNSAKKSIDKTDAEIDKDLSEVSENDFEDIDEYEFFYNDEQTTDIDKLAGEINNDLTNLNPEMDFEDFNDIEY